MRVPNLAHDFSLIKALELCEVPFRLRLLRELKKEILIMLPEWQLDSVREDYFLHQIQQTWSFEDLLELVAEVNSRHLQQNPSGRYAYLNASAGHFFWELRYSTESLQ